MFANKKTITQMVHEIAKDIIRKGDIVLDGTVGNGLDTLFLAEQVTEYGRVYGFDIQKQAIENTEKFLEGKPNVSLICDSHAHIAQYQIPPISCAMFNLGYLPGGDKSIVTTPPQTLLGIKSALKILKHNGIATIVSYVKHTGGLEEYHMLNAYLETLDKNFIVSKIKLINRPSNPPVIFIIER